MQRLPDGCLTRALAAGAREYFGWTRELVVLSDIYDAINVNTRATGMWKGKPPEFPQAIRPKSDKDAKAEKKPVSLTSVYQRFITKGA